MDRHAQTIVEERRRSILWMLAAPVLGALAMVAPKRAAADDAPASKPHKKTTEQRLDELESRIQIEQMRAMYGWYAVRGESMKMLDMFTDDCIFEASVTEGHRINIAGKEQLKKLLASVKPGGVIPTYHNGTIEIDGNTARGTVVMETRVSPTFPSGFSCYYDDRLRRVNGQWLFTSRKMHMYSPFFEKT